MKLNRKIVAVLALLLAQLARAATITVTATADSGPGSLRDALAKATDGDSIDATGISGTIVLTSGELLVNQSVAIFGPGSSKLAVDGNATSRVFHISSNIVVSIFDLTITNGFLPDAFPYVFGGGIYNDHATLTISNSTLTGNSTVRIGGGIANDGGKLTIFNSTLVNNPPLGGGIYNLNGATASVINCNFNGNVSGAIYNLSATMTLVHCTLSDNGSPFFPTGGGIDNLDGTVTVNDSVVSGNMASVGGGIYNFKSSTGNSSMQIANSLIISNSAGSSGGAIYSTAPITITNSTISGNSATGNGGGGIANHGALVIDKSTISHNTLSGPIGGGGILNLAGTITINSSTLSGNSAGSGAGIENFVGTLTVMNSTISSNLAFGFQGGGGIINYGMLTIVNSTFSENSASTGSCIYNNGIFGGTALNIGSTILSAGTSGGTIVTNESGTVLSLGYNLSSDDGGGFLYQPTDILNTDPMLGPLRDNGGATFTHALMSGSPAIDKGKNYSSSLFDQRGPGFVRTFDDPSVPEAPGGDSTDIGAFEVQTPPNQPPVARCRNVPVSADASCTASASIDNNSSDPDGDAITLSQSPPGPYPLGTNMVTLTVTDSHGASDACAALVIVQDTTPPQITCPTDITVDATSANGAVVSFTPVATDACSDPPIIVCEPPSRSTFPIGTTIDFSTATDSAGNSNSCQFSVTVRGPKEMLTRLLALVELKCPRPQPLQASLDAALGSIDRGNAIAAIGQLQAFQYKVGAQVKPTDPALAQELIQAAQRIIDVLNSGNN